MPRRCLESYLQVEVAIFRCQIQVVAAMIKPAKPMGNYAMIFYHFPEPYTLPHSWNRI
jgi:hypothetical protein